LASEPLDVDQVSARDTGSLSTPSVVPSGGRGPRTI
jgi:hypothetical protein